MTKKEIMKRIVATGRLPFAKSNWIYGQGSMFVPDKKAIKNKIIV